MTMYIVTVRIPKSLRHDPANKQTGACILSQSCTDVTGEHHSILIHGDDELRMVRARYPHITRVEKVDGLFG